MALTVIKPTGIDTSGNYTVNGMNVSANASVANLTVTTSLNLLTTSANLGPVGNVIITGGTSGYVLQTDGAGNLSWQAPASGSSISNGNSNVSIPTANGNINFTAVGNTVMVITGTGANIAGTANVSGNLTAGNANLGNSITANYFTGTLTTNAQPNITSVGNLSSLTVDNGTYGNVVITQFGSVYASGTGSNPYSIMQVTSNDTTTGMGMRAYAGLNGQIYSNSGITFTTGATIRDKDYPTGGTSRATLDSNGLAVTGNITAGNANLGNSVTANYFTGTLTTAAQPNITSVGTLTDLSVSGNGVFGGNLTVNGTLTYINSTTLSISDPIINLQTGPNGAAPVANSGKDVGTALNYFDTSAKIAWMGWDVSNAEIAFGSNVGIASEVVTFTSLANIRSGNAQLGNNVTANYFTGNGSLLTGITTTTISNGNSNVNIPSANGNINLTAVGNTTMVITGTGANIDGTANITGNLVAGNITAGSGTGGNITGGNVISANTFTASGNITAGNANLGNAVSANFFIGSGNNLSNISGSNVTGQVGNSLVSGTVYTNAQPNITSMGSLTGLTVSNATGVVNFTTTANVTLGAVANLHISGGTSSQYLQTDGAGNLSWSTVISGSTSNISNGNSNVNIPTANGNINFTAVGNTTMIITGTGANISGTANVTGNLIAGNITAGSGAGGSITGGNLVSANYLTGTLITAAQPNITSVGTLTTLAVSGTVTAVSLTANTGVITGNGNGLSSLVGANVTGQVGNALIAGTVYTNAQPNITSIGSLTGLTVSNATGVVNFTTTANVTLGAVANLHIAGGTNGYVLQTDGSGTLSWVAQSGGGTGSNISNGNSNVNIPTANGNITMSAVGNANIVVVTGTGVNVAGTLNVTGQSNLGAVANVIITGGTANYILNTDGAGNLSWTAPPAGANVTVDNFTGNGVQTVFTLSTTPIGINQTSVNYNGTTVLRTAYSLTGANITFSSAPANGSLIEITTINLTSGSGGSALTIQDEGSNLTTTASLINFVGNGIAATNVGNSVTVTVNTSGATAARALGYSLIFGG